MDPDSFKQAWKAQSSRTRLAIDAELLLKEVQRNQRYFATMIFWRDAREVGIGLLLVPVWLYLGITHAHPWTWYLTVPALFWIAGYMLVYRMRHERQPPEPGGALREHVESSLAQLDDQIWLLRNVFWWALLPLGLSALAFFGQIAWQERGGGWWTVLAESIVIAIVSGVFAGIHWLNQYAICVELEPRRQELEGLLKSLGDEPLAMS